MKSGTRILSTMAIAFFLAPALFADGTAKPADPSKALNSDEAASPAADPGAAAMPVPAAKLVLPLPAMFPRQGPAGGGTSESSQKHASQSKLQDRTTPKVELFVGYTYWWGVPGHAGNRIAEMNGASASVAYNFNRYLGLAVDVGGFKVDSLRFNSLGAGSTPSRVVDADSNVLTFLIGPRISFRSHSRLTPFLQILGGAAQADTVTVTGCAEIVYSCIPLPRETAFALTAGGGLDLQLNHRIAWRVLQAEFLLTRFDDPTSATANAGWQTNLRLSTGLVFRFGGNPPPPPPPVNHSPVASCSISPEVVYVGSGDTAVAHAVASDPDNDPLTYSWAANGGAVDGAGPDAKWNSSSATAGTYAVRVHVEDGRGGATDCSANVRVDPRPNRPPTMTCSANPSSVFAGEHSHITCVANDPDDDPLTYAWRANAGQIAGNGPMGEFDTSGLSPATYAITTRVDDGRGGAVEASTPVNVKAVPPAPMASKISECAFGKPLSARVDNVCKRILDDVALRLQNEPRATAVIIGYSDPSERKPAQVAGERASNAVKYLSEKGIDSSRVAARPGSGPTAGSDSQTRRIDVIWVPEGATY